MKRALLFSGLLVLSALYVILNNIAFPYKGIVQLIVLLAIAILIVYIIKLKRQV